MSTGDHSEGGADERTEPPPAPTGEPPADPATEGGRPRAGRWVTVGLVVVLAVVAGIVLWGVLPLAPQTGTIAVVPVEGAINGASAAAYGTALETAVEDPSVDAVVLRVNSPGGTAAASETMYLETLRASRELPVVTAVDAQALSGAYYTAVGSDYIVAKPASLVGSVGVVFTPPPEVEPTDDIISTGPNKQAGADQRGWHYNTETLQEAFLTAVVQNRNGSLSISRDRLATARIWTGTDGVDAGLADEIGGTRAAIAQAASMAGLQQYSVEVVRPTASPLFVTRANYLASNASNKSMESPEYLLGEPAARFPNYLMLPEGLLNTALVRGAEDQGNSTVQRGGVGSGG